jgi:hypothetical protein
MKSIVRRRFVPSHYYRELYKILQNLSQGINNVIMILLLLIIMTLNAFVV